MNFKELVQADLDNIFLNTTEFAEPHFVEYAKIDCVFANDINKASGYNSKGLTEPTVQLIAKISDLPKRKKPGNLLNVDNTDYQIVDWAEDMGMATITLKRTTGV